MGIKFGEIDASQILDNEFKIKTLEKMLMWIINNNSNIKGPTQIEIAQIQREVLSELQQKYPKSGIELK